LWATARFVRNARETHSGGRDDRPGRAPHDRRHAGRRTPVIASSRPPGQRQPAARLSPLTTICPPVRGAHHTGSLMDRQTDQPAGVSATSPTCRPIRTRHGHPPVASSSWLDPVLRVHRARKRRRGRGERDEQRITFTALLHPRPICGGPSG
jgi:hypothetical protein